MLCFSKKFVIIIVEGGSLEFKVYSSKAYCSWQRTRIVVRGADRQLTNLQIMKYFLCLVEQRVSRPLTDTWQIVILTDKNKNRERRCGIGCKMIL